MKQVSLDSFVSEWKEKLSGIWDKEIFSVYIANPFCKRKCKFCLYRSTLVSDELYHRYYNIYLPSMIQKLEEVLSLKVPDTFYFGGGTASLMTCDTMQKTFDLLPNLDASKSKSFEANPTSLSKEKIDVLAAYGFTELSLGVQTFCADTLKQQDRESIDIWVLSELVDYATSKGIFVNVDLLTYYESSSSEYINLLSEDLDIVSRCINPGKITVYPKYETYWGSTEEDKIQQIKKLRHAIKEFTDRSGYFINSELLETENDRSILAFGILDYHIYNSKCRVNAPRLRYNCSGPGYIRNYQNVIGLGGYGLQIPYSYIWNKKQWHIANCNWQMVILEDQFNSKDSPAQYLNL